ncbi:hypothetical protein [Pendulispora albinea]|uniref:Uncharacterized protein n=1 Tax=Pendulispora albinea TaxID=2741071 RepID=A0ABZ2M7A4_9BACT
MKRFSFSLAVAALALLSTAAITAHAESADDDSDPGISQDFAAEWEAKECLSGSRPACYAAATGRREVYFTNPGTTSIRVYAVGRKNGAETERKGPVVAPPGQQIHVGTLTWVSEQYYVVSAN